MTVKARIADADSSAHPLWPEETAMMSRSEYIWTQSIVALCGTLFAAAFLIYAIWGAA